VENVAALRRRGLDRVHGDLAALGYDTSWICLRASDIGAAHRRDRLFLLAVRADLLRDDDADPTDAVRT
jgi:DNA (cytosine-5)-methyltransferase 1